MGKINSPERRLGLSAPVEVDQEVNVTVGRSSTSRK
jgi:hypothetical protein